MGNSVFIDTAAYLACFCSKDAYNTRATKCWQILRKGGFSFSTSHHVLDELATLLGRRTSFSFSAKKLKEIYSSDTIVERTTEEDELEALIYFQKYADQKVSFTDCLSFVIMKKFNIKQVFTFDRHFEYAGFEIIS
jgi:uncharacterized protein